MRCSPPRWSQRSGGRHGQHLAQFLRAFGCIDRGELSTAVRRIGHLDFRGESPIAIGHRFHRPVIAAPVQLNFIDRYRDIADFDIDIGPG
jgi:hypothetical protein